MNLKNASASINTPQSENKIVNVKTIKSQIILKNRI